MCLQMTYSYHFFSSSALSELELVLSSNDVLELLLLSSLLKSSQSQLERSAFSAPESLSFLTRGGTVIIKVVT